MNKQLPILLLGLCLSFITIASPVMAADMPGYQGWVNDFAGLLTEGGKAKLTEQLTKLEADTGAEVAVVTVNNLGGSTIEDYAVKLFEKWGIGKKDKNNGIMFIVAKEERKVRIEVGYGLEPILTDGRTGHLLDTEVIPRLKVNDYDGGFLAGVAALEGYIRDGTPPPPLEDNPVKSAIGDFSTVFFFLALITVYLSGFMARSKNVWFGGIWGVIAGAVMGLAVGGIAATVISAIICGGLGTGFDYVLSRNYQRLKSSGKSTTWHQTWGGFGGGGHSGGGFGGFGGGMSGGGGASRGF